MKLEIKPVPVESVEHPRPQHVVLPMHEFTVGIIAPKGSGKTTLICNLLDFYKKYFNSIIIFSPTIKSDDKWEYVKKQPLLTENKELKKLMKKKKNQVMENQDEEEEKFDPHIPENCFLDEYDESVLETLMEEQSNMIKMLRERNLSKHKANRILMVFDDLVGSSLFNGKKDNPFKKLNTNHR
jgi:ABC-type dipeptide/oligopeptide/nickel transport system ATPase subunit